jgi:Tfp pilus assembly protein PilV
MVDSKFQKQYAVHHKPRTSGGGRSGQTILEAIAAIAVTIIVVTALVALGVRTVRAATITRNRSQAAAYAQEGIEAVRSIRDRSYADLYACRGDSAHKIVWSGSQWGCEDGTEEEIEGSIFDRSFTAEEMASDKLKVTVTVYWSDSAGDHTLPVNTYLTDWR